MNGEYVYKVTLGSCLSRPDKDSVVHLFKHAFDSDNNQVPQVRAHLKGGLSNVAYLKRSQQDKIVAALFFQERQVRMHNISSKLLSVGPLATSYDEQGKGLGSLLLAETEKYALENNIAFICLSGIPGFYIKKGYYPYLDKAKIVLKRRDIDGYLETCLRKINPSFKPSLCAPKDVAINYGNGSFNLSRTQSESRWLLDCGNESYYFPNPTLLSDTDVNLSYMCWQYSSNILTIRELHLSASDDFLRLLLFVQYMTSAADQIHIYTSYNSPIYKMMRFSMPFEYISCPHPSSRALLKLLVPDLRSHQNVFAKYLSTESSLYNTLGYISENQTYIERITMKPIEFFLPGLLTGHWKIKTKEDQFFGFSSSSSPPMLYQGDAM